MKQNEKEEAFVDEKSEMVDVPDADIFPNTCDH